MLYYSWIFVLTIYKIKAFMTKIYMYSRRIIFIIASLLIVVKLPAQKKPNIIVIVSDDGGYEDFGCYNGKDVNTPHIDALSKSGIRFTSAYTTASVCAPSRAGILTGRYQQRFGFDHNLSSIVATGVSKDDVGLGDGVKTIADYVKQQDYATIAIGKWHLGHAEKHHPRNRGFDHFFGFIGGARSYFPMANVNKESEIQDDEQVFPERNISYLTDNLTDKALSYIDRYKDKPFFMYLSYNAVHTPMEAKSTTYAKYQHIQDSTRRTFLAMLEDMDNNIGRVVHYLKANNLYDNTLIFFVNDNGAATNNGANNGMWRGLKGSKWEGGTRVPMIINYPNKVSSSYVSKAVVSTMDILKTIVDETNAKSLPHQVLDGKNILKTYRGKGHEYLFWRRGVASAVRYKNWKMIKVDSTEALLFDLENDPREQIDVASTYPKVIEKMNVQLEKWKKKMLPPKWYSSYGDYNQIMKHRIEVRGRDQERKYL